MDRMIVYVCENFTPDFRKVLDEEAFGGVELRSFESICENGRNIDGARGFLEMCRLYGDDATVFCGQYCAVQKALPERGPFKVITAPYCFHGVLDRAHIEELLSGGGYLIGSGWLNDWKKHMDNMGFNSDTAKRVFPDIFRELVCVDTAADPDAANKMKELSEYLKLPYTIIPCELESMRYMLRSVVYEWRIRKNEHAYENELAELRTSTAEYAAAMHILGELTVCGNQADAIEKIREIFFDIMGASRFNFQLAKDGLDIPEISMLDQEAQTMRIVLKHQGHLLGLIDAGCFLFPEHIGRYYNFAVILSHIFASVLTGLKYPIPPLHADL